MSEWERVTYRNATHLEIQGKKYTIVFLAIFFITTSISDGGVGLTVKSKVIRIQVGAHANASDQTLPPSPTQGPRVLVALILI